MSRHSRHHRQFDIHMLSVRPADPDDRPPSGIPIPGDTIVVQAEGSAADKDHENSPTLVPPWKDSKGGRAEWDPKSPKCSLNIFCRRRTRGKTVGYQITAIRTEYYGERETKRMLRNEPGLVYNDRTFFGELHNAYYYKMCSVWRRLFSLKTVRTFQLVKFTKDRTRRHTVVELDQDAFDDFLLDFYQPQRARSNSFVHIDWVFGLKQKDHRHALEVVESWSGWRVAFAGSIPGVISTGIAMVWALKGGELSTVFTVAGFVLAASALLVALLGFISETER